MEAGSDSDSGSDQQKALKNQQKPPETRNSRYRKYYAGSSDDLSQLVTNPAEVSQKSSDYEDDQDTEVPSKEEEKENLIETQVHDWQSPHSEQVSDNDVNLNNHISNPSENEEISNGCTSLGGEGQARKNCFHTSFEPSRTSTSEENFQEESVLRKSTSNRSEPKSMHTTYSALGTQSGTSAYPPMEPTVGTTALNAAAFYGSHNHHHAHPYHSSHHHHHSSHGYAGYTGSMYPGSTAENGSPPSSQTSNFGPSATQTSLSHHYHQHQTGALNYSNFGYPPYSHHHAHHPHPYHPYSGFLAAATHTNGSSVGSSSATVTSASAAHHVTNERLSSSVSPTYQGSTNTNNSNSTTRTSTTTNNRSRSTNNGSPLSTGQQLYPSNNQSSVEGGHSDLANGDEQHPTPKNNYSPPLKSTLSSAVDMLAATYPHHSGHSIFESYNMTNGHNQNIHQNLVAKKGKSGRGRGRRVVNPSPSPEQSLDRVFIWDLDETLILYNSLLNGAYCEAYYKGNFKEKSSNLGALMEQLLNWLGDSYFFYNELEEIDQTHVNDVAGDDNGEDLSSYNFNEDRFHEAQTRQLAGPMTTIARGGVDWMRKLAYRYRRIKEIYNQYRGNVDGLLGDRKSELDSLLDQINEFTSNWPELAKRCVEITNQRERCANVLVTQSPLVPTICKVLLYGFGFHFEIDNIYAAHKVGKDNIFQKLMNRYGKKCTFVVIGDGAEEETAARRMNMPFWRVSSHPDLVNLQRALVDFHM